MLSSIGKKLRTKKKHLGGPMQIEEIKMNKNLLKDINLMKKEMGSRSPGSVEHTIDEKVLENVTCK